MYDPGNILFMGRTGQRFENLPSTNAFALELLRTEPRPAEGFAVIASFQEAGRGQRGASWESEKGKNLCFSLILYPEIRADAQFLLSCVISLGISDYLIASGWEGTRVKWPNDILINGRKLAGILIENVLRGSDISASVAGIGLNVNQEIFTYERAVSLKNISGKTSDIEEVFSGICKGIESRYLQLKNKGFEKLLRDYNDRLFQKDIFCEYLEGDKKVKLKITGADITGKLNVLTPEGIRRAFNNRELTFIF